MRINQKNSFFVAILPARAATVRFLLVLSFVGIPALGSLPIFAQTPPPSSTCSAPVSWWDWSNPASGQNGVPLSNGVSINISDGQKFSGLTRDGGTLQVSGFQPGITYTYQVIYTGCAQEEPGSPFVCAGGNTQYQALGGHTGSTKCPTSSPPPPPPSAGQQTNADLTLENISWLPATPAEGNAVQIQFRIRNIGTDSAGPFVFFFQRSDGVTCGANVSGLSAQGTLDSGNIQLSGSAGVVVVDGIQAERCTANHFRIASAPAGGMSLFLQVDRQDQVKETNESNNFSSNFIRVPGTFTPTPAQGSGGTVSGGAFGGATPPSSEIITESPGGADPTISTTDGIAPAPSTAPSSDSGFSQTTLSDGTTISNFTGTFDGIPVTMTTAVNPDQSFTTTVKGPDDTTVISGPDPLGYISKAVVTENNGTVHNLSINANGEVTSITSMSPTVAAIASFAGGMINNSLVGLVASLFGNSNIASSLGIPNAPDTNITLATISTIAAVASFGLSLAGMAIAAAVVTGIASLLGLSISLFSGDSGVGQGISDGSATSPSIGLTAGGAGVQGMISGGAAPPGLVGLVGSLTAFGLAQGLSPQAAANAAANAAAQTTNFGNPRGRPSPDPDPVDCTACTAPSPTGDTACGDCASGCAPGDACGDCASGCVGTGGCAGTGDACGDCAAGTGGDGSGGAGTGDGACGDCASGCTGDGGCAGGGGGGGGK